MNHKVFGILTAIVVAAAAGCSSSEEAIAPPALVVVIVVDQMCPYHLDGFQDVYTGGFKRLLDEGVVFEQAYHDHAKTHTSPGHATIATGTVPARHGIVANRWYDRKHGFADTYSARDTSVSLVSRPDVAGASPHNLLTETIGDRLKSKSPDSKVIAVALKDYAAVMMGGRQPDAVYWYNMDTGKYCSSTYYMTVYPQWVAEFNAARHADGYLDAVWTKTKPETRFERSREDAFATEADGEHTTFPYSLSGVAEAMGESFYDFLRHTPFADELTLRFAAAIVDNESLGRDEATDLLFVGCSAADYVGHEWGPYSQEAEDYYLRLDGFLETFFQLLDSKVGPGEYTVVLTSDHGVLPMPEQLTARGTDAGRIAPKRYAADVDGVAARVARDLGVTVDVVRLTKRGLVLNDTAAAEAGITPARLRARVAQELGELPYIADVFTYDELLAGGGSVQRQHFPLFVNNFHPDRGPDLYVVLAMNYLLSGSGLGTTHGSCYDYDRRVPLVFLGKGVRGERLPHPARTVDIVPTLARVMGIDPGDELDGRVLFEALVESE
jgi:predicted AlkP superfamily pyrophosphatase or phosphodiesterase